MHMMMSLNDSIDSAPKTDLNSIRKCRAVKLLDNRNAISRALTIANDRRATMAMSDHTECVSAIAVECELFC